MSITTGIDIVKVTRIKTLIAKQGKLFLRRVFTEKEIVYCEKKVNKYQHYAARFAAKEAFLKAYPHKKTLLSYKNIEIHKKLVQPYIKINSKNYKKSVQPKSIALSISHEKEFAVAIVVLEL